MRNFDPTRWLQVASLLEDVERKSAVRQWMWLWIALVALGFVLIGVVIALGNRRRHAAALTTKDRKKRPIKDAWEEAGKRAEPAPLGDLNEPDEEEEEGER